MTTIETSTLRPGLLVSLKTSVSGGIKYDKEVLQAAQMVDGIGQQAIWKTERVIADPVEDSAARKARSQASSTIRRVCTLTAFGLLCPEADKDKLDEAIAKARGIIEEFNAGANIVRASIYIIAGRIAADDVEAVKALNSEVRELMDTMAQGLKNLDAKVVREAASKLREIGGMLSPDAEARAALAIETARKAANVIAKAGEAGSNAVDQAAIRKITEQRTAFLDLDDAGTVQAPKAKAAAVDLEPELLPSGAPVPQPRRFDVQD